MEPMTADKEDTSKLITIPGCPYTILDVHFNADTRDIQAAFRSFFRKYPKDGVKIGKPAQNKLLNTNERVRVDAMCVECSVPQFNLGQVVAAVELDTKRHNMKMRPNLMEFSDLYFPEYIHSVDILSPSVRDIPFRPEFDLP
jgi:hypothetical protein